MGKKNLNLVRRSIQRGERPQQVDGHQNFSPPSSKRERRQKWDGEISGKLYVADSNDDTDWQPTPSVIIKLLASFRLSAAIWSGISDCDEVFNYWEPMHLLLFGDGLQTWEYSPLYAIRSYFYVYLHAMPGYLLASLLPAKIGIFVGVRCCLALFSLAAEYLMYVALCNRFSNSIARFYVFFTAFSTGMFISSTAFLPSSFAMTMNTFAMAAYLQERWFWSIMCTVISAFVGWPFAALLGLPIAIDMCILRASFRNRALFVFYSLVSACIVGGAIVSADSYYYGKTVFAPLNIVLYNVFSTHGPDLYGVEPLSYYLKNLLLNWNISLPLSLLAVGVSAVRYAHSFPPPAADAAEQPTIMGIPRSLVYWSRFVPVLTLWMSLLVWLAVFFAQPHKEERFLFPAYPLIAVLAAVAIDAIHRWLSDCSEALSKLAYIFVAIFAVISFSRVMSLHRNFSGSIEVYKSLNEHFMHDVQLLDFDQMHDPVRVCVGKEWYRFPSSFYIPTHVLDKRGRTRRTQLGFLRSEFRGLLPKQWKEGSIPAITREEPTEMNDQNLEELSRYVKLETCDYLVDFDTGKYTEFEPDYKKFSFLRPLAEYPFLIPEKSHWFYRAFFIPYISQERCVFGRYTLFKRADRTVRD